MLYDDDKISDAFENVCFSEYAADAFSTALLDAKRMRDAYEAEIARLQAECKRLENAGIDCAYGETIKTGELEDYMRWCDQKDAEIERLQAERDHYKEQWHNQYTTAMHLSADLAEAKRGEYSLNDVVVALVGEPVTKVLGTDVIACPFCGQIQEAEVTQTDGDVWNNLTHKCERCGYIIMESEWSQAEPEVEAE